MQQYMCPNSEMEEPFQKLRNESVKERGAYIRPRSYKTFFVLNSAEHEFFHANKSQITNNVKFFLAKHN